MRRKFLSYKLEKFELNNEARFLIVHRRSYSVPVSASIYESSINDRINSLKGTAATLLQHLVYFYSWSEFIGLDLDDLLCKGHGLDLPNIMLFKHWLSDRYYNGKKLSGAYLSQIMGSCRACVLWFVRVSTAKQDGVPLNMTIAGRERAHVLAWRSCSITYDIYPVADDMCDVDYAKVERYLSSDTDANLLEGRDLRNYLIWRLAWEFGLRIGEVLSLRTTDAIFDGTKFYIRIQRVQERMNEVDCRTPYAPKVKTRSRDLGCLDPRSNIRGLIDIYLTKYRYVYRDVSGQSVKSPFLTHDYLFISDNKSGRPLSCSAAQKIAIKISCSTGVEFNWHLLRHAFFNRWYEQVSNSSGNSAAMDTLVYWGGWKSQASLISYVNRAIRDKARLGLIGYNKAAEKCHD